MFKKENARETLTKTNHNRKIDITNERFGKLVAIKELENDTWLCQCDCGNFHKANKKDLRRGHTQSCGCIYYSIGVANIELILKENKISFKKEKTFEDLKNLKTNCKLRYDSYLPNYNRLIEFDGIQHYKNRTDESSWFKHESFSSKQEKDKLKNKYALSHNIPLVRIPYWERDKITLDMLLGDEYLVQNNEEEEIIF